MATISKLLVRHSTDHHLRPFDVRRDLGAIADLVEVCFADTLDSEGERYLQQMRSAAHNAGFLRWASVSAEWASVPLSGYVWEEDGRLIGNLSLIPFHVGTRRYYLIANVAVHPEYRRRGIARALTAQAVAHAKQRGAPAAWLHVRANNLPAVTLYESLGFVERARRTTWHSSPDWAPTPPPTGITVGPRRSQHWGIQRLWLERSYPSDLTWHLPLNLSALRPGLVAGVYRFFSNVLVQQWSAYRDGRLAGVLAWKGMPGYVSSLWLATPPQPDNLVVQALLSHARQDLSSRRMLMLDFPAHQAAAGIQAAGFYEHQTLIWMSVTF